MSANAAVWQASRGFVSRDITLSILREDDVGDELLAVAALVSGGDDQRRDEGAVGDAARGRSQGRIA